MSGLKLDLKAAKLFSVCLVILFCFLWVLLINYLFVCLFILLLLMSWLFFLICGVQRFSWQRCRKGALAVGDSAETSYRPGDRPCPWRRPSRCRPGWRRGLWTESRARRSCGGSPSVCAGRTCCSSEPRYSRCTSRWPHARSSSTSISNISKLASVSTYSISRSRNISVAYLHATSNRFIRC